MNKLLCCKPTLTKMWVCGVSFSFKLLSNSDPDILSSPFSGCWVFKYKSGQCPSVSLKCPPLVYLCESWLVSRPGNVSSVSELLEPPAKTTFNTTAENWQTDQMFKAKSDIPIRHVSIAFSSSSSLCSYCCFIFHRRLQQKLDCLQLWGATAVQQLMDSADF